MLVLVSLELAASHQSALGIGPFARRRRCFRDKGANQPTRNDCLSRRTSSGSKATTKETYLASVMDSTTVFETVRRGSTPWRGTRLWSEATFVLGVCRTARDFAKVVDQVRFLARALNTQRPANRSRPMRYEHSEERLDQDHCFRADE